MRRRPASPVLRRFRMTIGNGPGDRPAGHPLHGPLQRERLRVRAAFCAAALRPSAPLVVTALRAAADRADAPRFFAADLACRASAGVDAAARPSCLSAEVVARERVRDTGLPGELPRAVSAAALRRVFADVFF